MFRLICFLFFFSNLVFAQTEIPEGNLNPFSIGARAHYGFVIQHSSHVESVQGAKPKGIELNFNWHLNSEKEWLRVKGYPSFGYSLIFFDYGKPHILGYGFAATMYLEYYFTFPSSFDFFVRGGVGPAYLTKPFENTKNNENFSYAMHLNFHLFVNLGFRWQMGKHLYGNFSVNMNHDSNAGIKEPNGGVNFPTVSLGAGYTFNPGKFLDRGYIPFKKTNRWDLAAYWGLSAVNYPDLGQFPMMGIDLIRSVQLSRVGALVYGFEFEFNGRGNWKNLTYHNQNFDPFRASVRGGWEFRMGRTKFAIALGAYVVRSLVESDFIYQRYTLVHHVSDEIFAGISFKSYRHVADFVDFRIGYSFN